MQVEASGSRLEWSLCERGFRLLPRSRAACHNRPGFRGPAFVQWFQGDCGRSKLPELSNYKIVTKNSLYKTRPVCCVILREIIWPDDPKIFWVLRSRLIAVSCRWMNLSWAVLTSSAFPSSRTNGPGICRKHLDLEYGLLSLDQTGQLTLWESPGSLIRHLTRKNAPLMRCENVVADCLICAPLTGWHHMLSQPYGVQLFLIGLTVSIWKQHYISTLIFVTRDIIFCNWSVVESPLLRFWSKWIDAPQEGARNNISDVDEVTFLFYVERRCFITCETGQWRDLQPRGPQKTEAAQPSHRLRLRSDCSSGNLSGLRVHHLVL